MICAGVPIKSNFRCKTNSMQVAFQPTEFLQAYPPASVCDVNMQSHHGIGGSPQAAEGEDEVPLACQTAIVKRRHRRTSAMPVSRYGSWAQQAELEAALVDLNAGGESDEDDELATGRRGVQNRDYNSRRRSALPVMNAAVVAAVVVGGPADAVQVGVVTENAKAPSRQRRQTLAPSQVCQPAKGSSLRSYAAHVYCKGAGSKNCN